MAKLGRDGTAGSTGGSRAFINSAARVRKNTNAVTGVAKVKDNYPSELTNALQKRSVKKVAPTETTRKTAPKTALKNVYVEIQGKMYKTGGPAEKKMAELRKLQTAKTVAKRATGPKVMKQY